MTNLIIMVGIPGSGKSTLANQLAVEYTEKTKCPTEILSSDRLRKELYGDENDQEHNSQVFEELYKRVKAYLPTSNVIIDATNITMKSRRTALDIARNMKNVHVVACVVATPIIICFNQNSKRERRVPHEVILGMMHRFEVPFYEEGFNEIRIYSADVTEKDQFMKVSNNNLIHAEIYAGHYLRCMEGVDQNNHHHAYDLGTHCRKCAEYMKEFAYGNSNLIKAAEIHDYGKLDTKVANKNNPSESSYYGHANVGAYNILSLPWIIGVNDIEDVLEIVFYVNYHMMPFDWNTDKAKEKYLKIFGENKYKNLINLNICDKKASKIIEE